MKQQVVPVAVDREGLVEVDRAGRIERDERHIGAVGMLNRHALRGRFGFRQYLRREVVGDVELGADHRQSARQRVGRIDDRLHRFRRYTALSNGESAQVLTCSILLFCTDLRFLIACGHRDGPDVPANRRPGAADFVPKGTNAPRALQVPECCGFSKCCRGATYGLRYSARIEFRVFPMNHKRKSPYSTQ